MSKAEAEPVVSNSELPSNKSHTRDVVLDIMRVFAMALVVVSHCSFPETVHSFSGECVAILVFLAGMSYRYSKFEWSFSNFKQYIVKRFKRLVLPVWGYLLFFIPFYYFFFLPKFPFSLSFVVKSFLLLSGGVLFVWVYRIFMIASITTPLMDRIFKGKPLWVTILVLVAVIVVNDQITALLKSIPSETVSSFLQYLISYTVSYGIIAYLGCLAAEMNQKEKTLVGLLFLCIYLISGYFLHFTSLEAYKYPPEMYFISFGVGFSLVLYVILDLFHFKPSNLITWASNNAMNMYIAHILPYHILCYFTVNPWVQFLILFFGSYLIVFSVEKARHSITPAINRG